jgi:hypothetical protein
VKLDYAQPPSRSRKNWRLRYLTMTTAFAITYGVAAAELLWYWRASTYFENVQTILGWIVEFPARYFSPDPATHLMVIGFVMLDGALAGAVLATVWYIVSFSQFKGR